MVVYHQICKAVAPKREALAAAEKAYTDACKLLAQSEEKTDADQCGEQPNNEPEALETSPEEALTAAAAALSALEMAATLDELDKKDIIEIKAMASPPPAVMIVCMCVVILRPLGKEDKSAGWRGAKAMLSDTGILGALQNYKKDEMKERQIKKIKDLLNKEKDIFEGEEMKKVSKAGFGLLQW